MVSAISLSSYYEKFLATREVKCIDDEIPFEIPQGWEWCRMGGIIELLSGQDFMPEKYNSKNQGIPYITGASSISNGKLIINRWTECPSVIGKLGDLLIVCKGSGVGKMCFCNVEKIHIARQIQIIRGFSSFICMSYLKLIIDANLSAITSNAQGVIPGISREHILNLIIPIPPFNAQQHIIKKLKLLQPLIQLFDSKQEELNNLDTSIKELLKKSILQEAIQGKLVPQIAKEGIAQDLLEQIRQEKQKLVKEGKLKKSALTDSVIYKGDDNKYFEKIGNTQMDITDEIPFEIPDSWGWVRLNYICSYIQRGKSPKYSLIKKYPVVAQKCNQWSGFSIEKAQFIDPDTLSSYAEERLLQDGDLMWNSTGLGTLGRIAVYHSVLNPYELAVADSHVTVIRPLKTYVLSQYLYYYFASDTVQSVIEDKSDGSTKQKELSTTTVKNYLVPIPPYREQQRIVEKIKTVTSIMRE